MYERSYEQIKTPSIHFSFVVSTIIYANTRKQAITLFLTLNNYGIFESPLVPFEIKLAHQFKEMKYILFMDKIVDQTHESNISKFDVIEVLLWIKGESGQKRHRMIQPLISSHACTNIPFSRQASFTFTSL